MSSKVDSSLTTSTLATAAADWSNLSCDLLSRIANSLGLIDFFSFRGVCKDWRVVSSQVSSEGVKSLWSDPWLLVYEGGEDISHSQSKCSLLSHDDKRYTINIPQLDGATCVASYEGWLLLFRAGSLFFFSPFSKVTIGLPSCPFTEVTTEHVAAFSCAPTCEDCIVALINRISDSELELFILCRGENLWARHCFNGSKSKFHRTRTALFYESKEFHFLDVENRLVIFSSKTKQWSHYRIREPSDSSPSFSSNTLQYLIRQNPLHDNKKKKVLVGLFDENNVSISICGTAIPGAVIQSEIIEAATQPESRRLRGIWIQPIYSYVPPGQTW